jgi:nitrite reductase/ring-hydroxylating ferredoxin subunit
MKVSGRARVVFFSVAMLLVAGSGLFVWVQRGASDAWVAAGSLADVQTDGVNYLPDERLFVVSAGDSVLALSALVPHRDDLGERVLYCERSGWFQGAHGEAFDRLGEYAFGPARTGLTRLAVRVVDGDIEVDPSTVVGTPARGDARPQQPVGPFCEYPLHESPSGFVEMSRS